MSCPILCVFVSLLVFIVLCVKKRCEQPVLPTNHLLWLMFRYVQHSQTERGITPSRPFCQPQLICCIFYTLFVKHDGTVSPATLRSELVNVARQRDSWLTIILKYTV